jgi:RNA polymerase sigma-70 factor (ECF subfamily)
VTTVQDSELISRLLAQEPAAQKKLFDEYSQPLYRLCFRFLNDVAEAEDAVQEVFLRALQRLDGFKGHSTLSTWLYRIAVNYCLNIRRQWKWRSRLNLDFLNDSAIISEAAADNPHAFVEKQEEKELVQGAILHLPDRQRWAIILSRYENKSYQEIAEIMNCSISAVESCLHHAKRNMSLYLTKKIKK